MKPVPPRRFGWPKAIAASGAFGALYVAAFPNVDAWWAALLCLAPMALWAYGRPSYRRFLGMGALAAFLACAALFGWIRHIHPDWGWAAWATLSAYCAGFIVVWFAALRWALGRCGLEQPALVRLVALLGLSAFWVVLEWARTWFLTGFPWLPLAASQWTQPALLQPAEWTGAWGVSFLLVFVNLCVAGYLRSLYRLFYPDAGAPAAARVQMGGLVLRARFHAELYFGVLALLGCVSLMTLSLRHLQTRREPLFRAGVVQPYLEPDDKWSSSLALRNWSLLRTLTQSLRNEHIGVLLWPEAATPYPIFGENSDEMRAAVEALVREMRAPLLTGNIAGVGENWYNGIFLVSPETGVFPAFYAKRHLVPFGEYVPLRDWPFVAALSPVKYSLTAGQTDAPIMLSLGSRTLAVGALVCYEDVFPELAAAQALAGADFFFVATNNAWYGEEAGAYQHAAHAVLRAVETRRPFVRCGNGGWSGWIDELGYAREWVRLPDGKTALAAPAERAGTIYFRGAGAFDVARIRGFAGYATFYVRHGEWFVWACAGVCLVAALRLRFGMKMR